MGDGIEVEEKAENITGWFHENYVIVAPADDSIKRYFTVYELSGIDNPKEKSFVYIPSPSTKKEHGEAVMNATIAVLKKAAVKRSNHFPRFKYSGHIKRLVFGSDGFNEPERDPEWTHRPYVILQHKHALVSSLTAFSETGFLPTELALHTGLGIAYCLAALHRLGFIHRFVTPHSFSYPVPIDLETLKEHMIITDFSLCMEYPYKHGPRLRVPFTGCLRYATIRAHAELEQGPADDYISLIYVVAEMITGKLPWRSIYDKNLIAEKKCEFKDSKEFKRLPRELRKLYHDLLPAAMNWIDPAMVIEKFKAAIERKDPNHMYELPKWLLLPPKL